MLRVSEGGGTRPRQSSGPDYRLLRKSILDLQTAADLIFDTISKRTAEEKDKLTDISARIQKAKAKIDVISKSKKEITITSPANYPKPKDEVDFPTLFSYKDRENGAGFPVAELVVDGGLRRGYGADGTLELFQFFSETRGEFLQKKVPFEEGSCAKGQIIGGYNFQLPTPTDEGQSDSSLKTKQPTLPPPPPSLLLHNAKPIN